MILEVFSNLNNSMILSSQEELPSLPSLPSALPAEGQDLLPWLPLSHAHRPLPDQVQLSTQYHGGKQTARQVRQLKEKSQVLQSLFNLQDQYLCNIHVVGLNICYRIKYFCAALVTSPAFSAWGCW